MRSGPDTNAQGFRDDKDFSRAALDGSGQRVMILGDSFMAGAGTSREQSVPALLNERLGGTHQVFNVAVPGWGIDQMYLAYGRYKDVLKPHVVILAFIDEDVSRVLQAYRNEERLNKPSFTLDDDGKLRQRTARDTTSPLLNGLTKHSCLLSLMVHEAYLGLEARPIVSTMFSQMARESREHGRRFVVLRIPRREQSSLSGRIVWYLRGWQTAMGDVGAEYLDPLAEMQRVRNWAGELYVEDGHLSEAGSRLLAAFIHSRVF